jgi:putative chitinase
MVDSTNGSSGRLLAVTDAQLSQITGLSLPVPPGTADSLNDSVVDAGIITHLELAHYVAQTCYESNYFRTFVEPPVPGRYEYRRDLGNVNPGDGQLFRGRGAIQLTGRANYAAFGAWLAAQGTNADVEGHPELVGTGAFRFLAAAFYWSTHPSLRAASDNDDVAAATSIITGARPPGLAQGLQQRQTLTDRAEEVIG